jgi:ATP-dependent Lhr-like helicase
MEGRTAWCDRRLLARIRRYTLDRLRQEIEPVTAAQFLSSSAVWQHVEPDARLDGPAGVREVVQQLAGFEAPAVSGRRACCPARVRGYKREWLDQLALGGEVAWLRLWGGGQTAVRRTPITLVPRDQLEAWTALSAKVERPELGSVARQVQEVLARAGSRVRAGAAAARASAACRGGRRARLPRRRGARDLRLLRRLALAAAPELAPQGCGPGERALEPGGGRRVRAGELQPPPELVARQLLRRTGVIFRRTMAREKVPSSGATSRALAGRWSPRRDPRGPLRGGFDGEQYALPEAIPVLAEDPPRGKTAETVQVSAVDPLNFQGILTPEARVPATSDLKVQWAEPGQSLGRGRRSLRLAGTFSS